MIFFSLATSLSLMPQQPPAVMNAPVRVHFHLARMLNRTIRSQDVQKADAARRQVEHVRDWAAANRMSGQDLFMIVFPALGIISTALGKGQSHTEAEGCTFVREATDLAEEIDQIPEDDCFLMVTTLLRYLFTFQNKALSAYTTILNTLTMPRAASATPATRHALFSRYLRTNPREYSPEVVAALTAYPTSVDPDGLLDFIDYVAANPTIPARGADPAPDEDDDDEAPPPRQPEPHDVQEAPGAQVPAGNPAIAGDQPAAPPATTPKKQVAAPVVVGRTPATAPRTAPAKEAQGSPANPRIRAPPAPSEPGLRPRTSFWYWEVDPIPTRLVLPVALVAIVVVKLLKFLYRHLVEPCRHGPKAFAGCVFLWVQYASLIVGLLWLRSWGVPWILESLKPPKYTLNLTAAIADDPLPTPLWMCNFVTEPGFTMHKQDFLRLVPANHFIMKYVRIIVEQQFYTKWVELFLGLARDVQGIETYSVAMMSRVHPYRGLVCGSRTWNVYFPPDGSLSDSPDPDAPWTIIQLAAIRWYEGLLECPPFVQGVLGFALLIIALYVSYLVNPVRPRSATVPEAVPPTPSFSTPVRTVVAEKKTDEPVTQPRQVSARSSFAASLKSVPARIGKALLPRESPLVEVVTDRRVEFHRRMYEDDELDDYDSDQEKTSTTLNWIKRLRLKFSKSDEAFVDESNSHLWDIIGTSQYVGAFHLCALNGVTTATLTKCTDKEIGEVLLHFGVDSKSKRDTMVWEIKNYTGEFDVANPQTYNRYFSVTLNRQFPELLDRILSSLRITKMELYNQEDDRMVCMRSFVKDLQSRCSEPDAQDGGAIYGSDELAAVRTKFIEAVLRAKGITGEAYTRHRREYLAEFGHAPKRPAPSESALGLQKIIHSSPSSPTKTSPSTRLKYPCWRCRVSDTEAGPNPWHFVNDCPNPKPENSDRPNNWPPKNGRKPPSSL